MSSALSCPYLRTTRSPLFDSSALQPALPSSHFAVALNSHSGHSSERSILVLYALLLRVLRRLFSPSEDGPLIVIERSFRKATGIGTPRRGRSLSTTVAIRRVHGASGGTKD
ncbi:hypothetical protein NMY22_g11484 [Coprinellus aureogranulatus]|nr:hypothetical protein NMY22_g11484 [Coprinellus aureogranulatus]